jgi:hypothetical protein
VQVIFVDKAGKETIFTQDAQLLAALLRGELSADSPVRTSPDAAPVRLSDTEEFRQSAAADWNREKLGERKRVRRYRWQALACLVLGILLIFWVSLATREQAAGGKLLGESVFYLLLAWLASRVVTYWLDRPAKSLVTLVLFVCFLCWTAAQSLLLYHQHQGRWIAELTSRLTLERDQAQGRLQQATRGVDLKPLSPEMLVDAGKLADTRAGVARLKAAQVQYHATMLDEMQKMSDAAEINLHDPADRAEFNAGVAKAMHDDAPLFDAVDAQERKLDAVDALLEFCQQRLGKIRLQDGQLVFASAQDAARYQELLGDTREASRKVAQSMGEDADGKMSGGK